MFGNSPINKYLIVTIIILAVGVPAAYAITITLGADPVEILGILDMMGNRITNVGTPTMSSDAATKAYVDSAPGTDTLALLGCAEGEIAKFVGSTWTCASEGGSSSIWMPLGSAASVTGVTRYGCNGASQSSDPLSSCFEVITVTGQISDLTAISALSGALVPPGTGETYTVTLYVNGVATGLSCTISGAVDTSCTDSITSVPISPGDAIDTEIIGSGSAATTRVAVSAILTT